MALGLGKKFIAVLTEEERTQLESICTAQPNTVEAERSRAVLLSDQGSTPMQTAIILNRSEGGIRGWIANWNAKKFASLPNVTHYQDVQKGLLHQRDVALHARFAELYEKKRMRHDDALEQLSKEFFITPRTIRGLLKKELKEQVTSPAQS